MHIILEEQQEVQEPVVLEGLLEQQEILLQSVQHKELLEVERVMF